MDTIRTSATTAYEIRAAQTAEAALLGELALRSKGHWGYDARFLDACRAELTVTPDDIARHPFYVLETEGRIAGFYSLRDTASPDDAAARALEETVREVELNHLYVEPSAIGKGFGKSLWTHALTTAVSLGFGRLTIPADPFAEPFYLRMGAVRAGEVASGSIAGRVLPLLHFVLAAADTPDNPEK